MKKIIYGIYGASGYGKEVLPLLKKQLKSEVKIYFIDDTSNLKSLNNCEVIDFDTFININADMRYVTIAISNSKIREKLTRKCMEYNLELIDILAENSVILDNVTMDKGAIISPFVTLTSDIIIGKSFQANIYSYVAHDCTIGDYVTFAPAVKCNGNVIIENHVYIGTGVIIHQGKNNKPLIIGEGAIVAAGSVVTKNVPKGMTVFGNPAIELTKENLKRRR